MKVFNRLYHRVLGLSADPRARYWLALISFSESTVFPLPPDLLLVPMVLANRQQANRLALITTLASVIGGMLGYLMGVYLLDFFMPQVINWGYQPMYELALSWFAEYGIWIIFLAGFTPIPYKVFSIAAGAFGFAFLPFVLVSIIGRGARFFLVARLVAWKGQQLMDRIDGYIDTISYVLIGLGAVYVLYYYLI